ncbi:relaxase MobL [Kitasatospora sp. NPDC098663]|uniref:relaxase MobL n=1 Tax=Kitasatospora sp. NPDC098663 TaxID=3364096 RepID=UPI0037F3886A
MSLKQGIVIVNEFSVPLPGGKGSRGATPGDYVIRYMAREQATESLAPIQRLRTDDFILRYMARESAVERAGISRGAAKREMRQAQGKGGVAFGYGSVSLSDEQLKAASKDIQHYFDAGHTVLKTVLSFDEEYLRKHKIVDVDFHCEARGDYRGHIDQMKLRMAIMHGLERMSSGTSGFDDLRYVGVIQIDTEHVHCHLAMVDGGRGQVTKNGTQRGKLLDRHKSRLRRGVDAWLDD